MFCRSTTDAQTERPYISLHVKSLYSELHVKSLYSGLHVKSLYSELYVESLRVFFFCYLCGETHL